MRIVTFGVCAALFLACGSAASGGGPWALQCKSMPVERTAPAPLRAAARRFFPWVRPAAKALHSGPVYVVALSSRSRLSRDGDATDSSGYYLHRALVAVAPRYRARITLSGRRLGGATHRGTLGFSTDGATACTVESRNVACASRRLRFSGALVVEPHPGWRIVPTELRIGRTGCFELRAAGTGVHVEVPLAVPGPDYGTAGW
jgi:hypothetical protein